MPRVSILMSVYNDAAHLAESLDSMIGQTFADWELLLVDDGSTDGSKVLAETYSKRDTRIRLLANDENHGLAWSLNRAMQEAEGEYLARMDSDDISLPERLAEEIEFLDQHPEFAFVGSWVDKFAGDKVWDKWYPKAEPQKKDFRWCIQFIHPTMVFRSAVLKQAGGYRVNQQTRRAEDYELCMRLYAEGYRGYNIQKVLLLYRMDQQGYQKKKYRFRLDEAKIRYEGFQRMGLLPGAWPYVVKPLLVGLIPNAWKYAIRRLLSKSEKVQ